MTRIDELENFSEDEFDKALTERYRDIVLSTKATVSSSPHAILLGGQSGAGKSTLHFLFFKQYDGNIISINGDEYRSSHPRFHEIASIAGADVAAHTATWSGKMTEGLIDALSSAGYNLIIEGTLRTADAPKNTARFLRMRGYAVSLALMAVKPEISLISCQIRYEQMCIAGTTPRATGADYHNKIVHEIVGNLTVLEQSDLFDGIHLYDRAGNCLFPGKKTPGTASETLRGILFGPWSEDEKRHYQHLQRVLKRLQEK